MKRICMLGWYGTETIGDRAILDGILRIFDKSVGEFELIICSLYPFFTERTLIEDGMRYTESAPNGSLSIIDVYDKFGLRKTIEKSDFVIMGGGPIMNLDQLSIIVDGFVYAKKKKKQTCILGAGLGPLRSSYYIELAGELLKYSDYIWFRDTQSCELAKSLYGNKWSYKCMGDPALFSAKDYSESHFVKRENILALNFRSFPAMEYGASKANPDDVINRLLSQFISFDKKIYLVPMHTFNIGGDDRVFLYSLARKYGSDLVQLPERPLSLTETYDLFMKSDFCLGMRYHSVVLQTILNGNNYIVDYTEPHKGKISGFLTNFDLIQKYNNRYINIREPNPNLALDIDSLRAGGLSQFDIRRLYTMIDAMSQNYVDHIKKIFE